MTPRETHIQKTLAEFREKFSSDSGSYRHFGYEDKADVEAFLTQALTDISDLSIEACALEKKPEETQAWGDKEGFDSGWNCSISESEAKARVFRGEAQE